MKEVVSSLTMKGLSKKHSGLEKEDIIVIPLLHRLLSSQRWGSVSSIEMNSRSQ